LAKDLRERITGVKQSIPEPDITQSASPSNISQLKDLVDKANERVENTKQALEDANNEIIDSRDAIRQSYELRDSAQKIVDADTQRAVSQAGGRISAKQQIADAQNRKNLNDARNQVESSEARAISAEQNRNRIADELVQHQNTLDNATKDLERASNQAGEIESSVGSELSTGAEVVSTAVADSEKALKVAKDITEVGEVADETADPLGLIVTGIGAIASQIIGRNIKAHTNVLSGVKPAPTTYSSTIGA
jgi:chromosome segregation ATPase